MGTLQVPELKVKTVQQNAAGAVLWSGGTPIFLKQLLASSQLCAGTLVWSFIASYWGVHEKLHRSAPAHWEMWLMRRSALFHSIHSEVYWPGCLICS